jgi:hypothetical protein
MSITPKPPVPPCPKCASTDVTPRETRPPPGPSSSASALPAKRVIVGYRCQACGHVWGAA